MNENIKVIKVNDYISLKQIEMIDANDMFTTIDTQRNYLGTWLPFVSYTKSIENTKDFINKIENTPDEEKEYIFVIKYSSEFAGLIGFKATDKLNKKSEIGYWLSESFQKKGIITQSVKSLIDFAFNELEINRIQIKCAVANIPSRSIPIRLGFEFEGIERDGELLSDNLFTDIEVYSLLRSDVRNW